MRIRLWKSWFWFTSWVEELQNRVQKEVLVVKRDVNDRKRSVWLGKVLVYELLMMEIRS